MIITETGVLVSTDKDLKNPAPLVFKIEGGQVGENQVRATGLTGDTTYFAQAYFKRDGIVIRQKDVTEFHTAAQEEVLKIKNAYAGQNTVGTLKTGTPYSIALEYSTDQGETWNSWRSDDGNLSVTLEEDEELWLKGENYKISKDYSNYYSFTSTQEFDCEGSLSAILRRDISVIPDSCFCRLFRNTKIVTPPSVPALDVMAYGFYQMFYGCTSLASAPALPSTTVSDYCYSGMFNGCTALTTAPALPATVLSPYCYQQMFMNCSALLAVPSLPATTIAKYCYDQMFSGCTSLISVPVNLLPATTLAERCYFGLFNGCTSLTNAPDLPATTMDTYCYGSMFYYCPALAAAPALPATVLANNCYNSMFRQCTSITTAPVLPATTLYDSCYRNMFYSCTSLTSAPTLSAATLASGCYSGMFNGCSSLNRIVCYATSWTTGSASGWVNGVAASGDFYNLGGATIPIDSNSGVPIGWTEHNYLGEPMRLTNTANGANTITMNRLNSPNVTIEYSTDGTNWTNNGPLDGNISVTLQSGEYIMFRGTNGNFNTESRYIQFSSTGDCEVSGDINTLLNSVGGDITLPLSTTFYKLFAGMTHLENGGIILPSTTLSGSCYEYMFDGCTSLTQAPALPATTLAVYCYQCMFRNCTSLTTAPALPATVLTRSCYYGMFKGCTALVNAPALPATSLAQNCYYSMFDGCNSLETAPTLPASTLSQECYSVMFSNCSSLNNIKVYATTWNTSYTNYWVDGVSATGDFYNLGGATIPTGTNGIPSGWTVHTSL